MQSKEWRKSESNFQTALQDFSLASDLSFFISLLVDQMSVWKQMAVTNSLISKWHDGISCCVWQASVV